MAIACSSSRATADLDQLGGRGIHLGLRLQHIGLEREARFELRLREVQLPSKQVERTLVRLPPEYHTAEY